MGCVCFSENNNVPTADDPAVWWGSGERGDGAEDATPGGLALPGQLGRTLGRALPQGHLLLSQRGPRQHHV